MSLLAVVDRELRASARRPITWRIRVLIPGLAFLFCAFSLWVVTLFGETPIPGIYLYQALTWISFGGSMLIGASVTADSISSEKREGTLGLLFLTPLRGYHIGLGKFLSSGITCIYSLIAVFPMLALPLLLGGVGIRELLLTILALLASNILGLSLGLFASVLVTHPWKAAGLALFSIFVFDAVLPALSAVFTFKLQQTALGEAIFILSPSYLVNVAAATAWGVRFAKYWQSLAAIVAVSSLLLFLIAMLLPHVWKDRPGSRRTLFLKQLADRWRYGRGEQRTLWRTRLLGLNPFSWLASRTRWASTGLVFFASVLFLSAFYLWYRIISVAVGADEFMLFFGCFAGALGLLHLGIVLRLAVLACDRLSTDRKSGALELVMSTPLTVQQILRGQWLALARQLWGALVIAFLGEVFLLFFVGEIGRIDTGQPAYIWNAFTIIIAHLRGGPVPLRWESILISFLVFVICVVATYCWFAVGWLSMWFGLRLAVQIRAPWFAIVLVYMLPWPLFASTMALLEHYHQLPSEDFLSILIGIVIAAGIFILNATLWLLYARWQLYKNFRAAATDRYTLFNKRSWLQRILFGKSAVQVID